MATATPKRPVPAQLEQSTELPAIELQHLLDPCDVAFAHLAAEHGDKVSTLADYPDFAARFAITEDDAR